MKYFVRHSIIYIISTFFVRGLSFIMFPILTRYLSPADYGIIDLISITGLFVLASFGLETYQGIARHISSYTTDLQKRSLVSSVLFFLVISFGILILLVNIFHSLFIVILPIHSMLLINIVLISYFAQAVMVNLQATLRFDLRVNHTVIASTILAISTIIMNLVFVVWLQWKLDGAVYALALGNLIGITCTLFLARDYLLPKINLQIIKQILFFSYPLAVSAIFTIIMLYTNRVLLKQLLGLSDVGIFGAGYRVASIIGLIMVGIQGALAPLIYSNVNDPNTPSQLAKLLDQFIVIATIFVSVLSFFAYDIVYLITNNTYYAAAGLVKFLVLSILLSNMYLFFPGMSIKKDTLVIMYLNIFGAILNLVLNYFLIKQFGLYGSAIATLITYILFLSFFIYCSQRRFYLPINYISLSKNILMIISAFVISFFINSVSLYMLIIKLFITAIFLLILLAINYEHVKQLIIWRI